MSEMHFCLKRTKEQLIADNELTKQVGDQICAKLDTFGTNDNGEPLYLSTEADRHIERHYRNEKYGESEVDSMNEFHTTELRASNPEWSASPRQPAPSLGDTMGTAEMAKRLRCSQTHARRLIVTRKPSWIKYKKGRNWAIPRGQAEHFMKSRLSPGGLE